MSLITVANAAGLMSALHVAQGGDVIQLAPGVYSKVSIYGLKSASDITITSVDPSHPAVLTDLTIVNSIGLTFSQLELSTDASGPSDSVADPYPFSIGFSHDIHFDSVDVHGSLDRDAANDRSGPLVYLSADVSFTNSQFHQLSFGIVNSASDHLVFSGNEFYEVRSGGIVGDASFVEVFHNYFHDFQPTATDHPDAVHFYNQTGTEPPHDIHVSGNVIARGAGGAIQGIFLELPFATSVPTYNVSITDNLLVGTLYNAIAVLAQDGTVNHGIVISNNSINSIGDITARIWVGNSDGTLIGNNVAGAYIFGTAFNASFDPKNTNTNITIINDVISSPVTDGGQALFFQWLTEHPEFAASQENEISLAGSFFYGAVDGFLSGELMNSNVGSSGNTVGGDNVVTSVGALAQLSDGQSLNAMDWLFG